MQKRISTALMFSTLLAVGGLGVAHAADDNPPPSAPAANTPAPMPGYYGQMPGGGPSNMGPGMMGRYGAAPGAQNGGYGSGYGPYHPYGRGGYGMGSGGYSGYHGYGPHYGGMGPGMGGMGSGMSGMGMGLGPIWALDLSNKQRTAIMNLMQQQQKSNWQRMTEMMTDSAKLQKLYSTEKWDADAIGKVYGDLFKLRREGIVSMIKMRNQIIDQLTDAQRKELRERYGWR